MTDLEALVRLLTIRELSWHDIVEVLTHHKAAQRVSYDKLCDMARTSTETYWTAVNELREFCEREEV